MNMDLISRKVEIIQDTMQHPKGWFGLCSIFLIIDQYIFSQWNFALGFFMLVLMDTMVGSYVAYQRGKFSGRKFRKMLADKFLVYFTIIISFSIGTKITLQDGSESIIKYLNIPLYSLFITVELSSIVRKWYTYKPFPFLKKIMQHFKWQDFEEDKKNKINE